MKEYICTETMVPLRMGPSHKSEMGSMILMGEKYTILDTAGLWTKIQVGFDSYSGWVDNDHFLFVENQESGKTTILGADTFAQKENGEYIFLYAGSELFVKEKGLFMTGNNVILQIDNKDPFSKDDTIIASASKFLNAPYLWGGRISHGIDCSGLSQLAYKIHGKNIPRDSFNQASVDNN